MGKDNFETWFDEQVNSIFESSLKPDRSLSEIFKPEPKFLIPEFADTDRVISAHWDCCFIICNVKAGQSVRKALNERNSSITIENGEYIIDDEIWELEDVTNKNGVIISGCFG